MFIRINTHKHTYIHSYVHTYMHTYKAFVYMITQRICDNLEQLVGVCVEHAVRVVIVRRLVSRVAARGDRHGRERVRHHCVRNDSLIPGDANAHNNAVYVYAHAYVKECMYVCMYECRKVHYTVCHPQ